MYKAYKQTQNKAEVVESVPDTSSIDDVDNEVKAKVAGVWDTVEKQCEERAKEGWTIDDKESSTLIRDWNIVRVFVSSTFADFFNEREVLVKKVFPELREWCYSRKLKLIECDLRWGVPRDTPSAETILICLDEIERCRKTNKGQPFFLTLVGERYGWIPGDDDLHQEAKEQYGWVNGTSITFMEILNGAYRDNNPNAAFFIRDGCVCDDIPEAFSSRFVDTEPLAKHHLREMKKKISEKFYDRMFPYSCKYKQISDASGRERVELTDLDDFAEGVLHFFQSAIDRMYPIELSEEVDKSPDAREQELQWLFAVDQARSLTGRQPELDSLKEFIDLGQSSTLEVTGGDAQSFVRPADDWDLQESDVPMCTVEAFSGWGKTALMCKLIVDTVKKGVPVFYHVVGSTPSSNQLSCLLRRLLNAIAIDTTDDQQKIIDGNNTAEQKKLFRQALAKHHEKQIPQLKIIIDGLNELDDSETVGHLSWLPPSFPRHVHCVVSANMHRPTLARLYEHPVLRLTLSAMAPRDLSLVAQRYLDVFNKTLEPKQLEKLVLKTGVNNPMWMTLMVEELRIFGDFRLLDEKIENFPTTMDDLLVQIIDRLIFEDDKNQVIKKVLCCIACSQHGLPSDKVPQICGDVETKKELAPLHWARARRSLKPYLRTTGFLEDFITFSHESVSQAVHNHLLHSAAEQLIWNTKLADYFQYWCKDAHLKVTNLPHHLKRAALKKRLVEFLCKDGDSYKHMNSWLRSRLLEDIRCRGLADAVMPHTSPLMLCTMCAMRNQGFNPAQFWPNKSCCVLCGNLCNNSRSTVEARVCMRHRNFRGMNIVKCSLCESSVVVKHNPGPVTPTVAKLCMHCGFGNGGKQCSAFDV